MTCLALYIDADRSALAFAVFVTATIVAKVVNHFVLKIMDSVGYYIVTEKNWHRAVERQFFTQLIGSCR